MPPVRCMWYDDDGHPSAGSGCRTEGTECTYVHPTSPDWGRAIRKKTAVMRGGGGRGRGGGFTSPSSRDNGWNGRRRSSNNSEWDAAAWKPKNTDASASTASSIPSSTPEPSTSKVVGQWGSSDTNGGWGKTSAATTDNNAGGWGAGGGWGEGGGWGSSGGWGETTTTTENNSSGWGAGGGAANTSAIIDPVPMDAPSTQPPPPRPKDLWVNVDDKMVVDAPVPPQSSSSYRAASQAPSERTTVCETPQSAFPPFAVPRSAKNMTRSEIHSGIIKNSVRVTRIQLELKELQRQVNVWKKTQHSQQFHYVSKSAGTQLDKIRTDLANQINVVEIRLKHAEDELLRYPELPSCAPNGIDVDTALMSYTDELKSWLESFMALAVPETKAPSADSSAMDSEPDFHPNRPESRIAEIEARITKLEDDLSEAEQVISDSDLVSPEKNAAYIEEALSAARSRLMNGGDPSQENTAQDGSVAELKAAAEIVDEKLRFHAEQVVLLLEKNERGKQRIKAREAERDQNARLLLAMQTQLEMAEKRREERAKQLALMAEQMARFAARKPEPKAVLDDTILSSVQTTVQAMIQGEVVPALKALGAQYEGAIERRMKSLQQSIQPAVDQTNEICQRAMQIDS